VKQRRRGLLPVVGLLAPGLLPVVGLLAPGLLPALALLLAPTPLAAQVFDRPADERPPLPEPGPAGSPAVLPSGPEALRALLPPVGLPEAAGPRFVARGFRIHGVTAFDAETLRAVVAPWVGREIDSADLVAVQNALTNLYVEHGYVSSGALIPDQDPSEGFVEVHVVEGSLAAIRITEAGHFREGALRARIGLRVDRPLDLDTLEENLQRLQQDPRVERVHARLVPGERRGEAVLLVRVLDRSPYRVSLEASNHSPPAFGSYRGGLRLAHENLLGLGDTLEGRLLGSHGLLRGEVEYAVPLNARGTALRARADYADSRIVEGDFEALDIQTRYQAYGIGLDHPVYRTLQTLVTLGPLFEWRRADTCFAALEELIGCDPFSFLGSGAVDGVTTVSVLRLSGQWLRLERNQVFALRSLLSVGLPVLGAAGGGVDPDGQFVSWLGQFQWARRFERFGIQTIFRTDVQLTSDALPSLEQIPLGGHASVRGYRENLLVRDQGVVSSLELRVPVVRAEGRAIVEVAPFADFGYAKNRGRASPGPDVLASVGLGLRFRPTSRIDAALYWGHQLESVPTPAGTSDLQDDGIQFRVDWNAF
jgi:hemolysin activation/secretion protein